MKLTAVLIIPVNTNDPPSRLPARRTLEFRLLHRVHEIEVGPLGTRCLFYLLAKHLLEQ